MLPRERDVSKLASLARAKALQDGYAETFQELIWSVCLACGVNSAPALGYLSVIKRPKLHRVAISNGRLLGLENGRVRFRWRDSQDHNQIKEMSLEAVEFIRRFLLHVLPSGFVKIRHFGFLSNRNRKKMVQHCRGLLPPSAAEAIVWNYAHHSAQSAK